MRSYNLMAFLTCCIHASALIRGLRENVSSDLIVTRSCQFGLTKYEDLVGKFGKMQNANKLFTSEVHFSTYIKVLNAQNGAANDYDDVQLDLQGLMLDKIASSVLSCARLSTLLPARESIDDVIEISIESEFAGEVSFSDPESPCYTSEYEGYHRCPIIHSQIHLSFLNPYDKLQLQYQVLQSIKKSVEDGDYIVPTDSRVLHVGYMGPDPSIVKSEAAALKQSDGGVRNIVVLTLLLCMSMMLSMFWKIHQRKEFFRVERCSVENESGHQSASSKINDLKLLREWSYDRPNCLDMASISSSTNIKDTKTLERNATTKSCVGKVPSKHVTFRTPSFDEEVEICFIVDRSGGRESSQPLNSDGEEINSSPLFRYESVVQKEIC